MAVFITSFYSKPLQAQVTFFDIHCPDCSQLPVFALTKNKEHRCESNATRRRMPQLPLLSLSRPELAMLRLEYMMIVCTHACHSFGSSSRHSQAVYAGRFSIALTSIPQDQLLTIWRNRNSLCPL